MTNLYTTTEKTRGKPLNIYEAKGKKIAQARLLFIITYRPCKRACINIQNISFVRSYLCLFFLFFARSVSFFFPVLGLLIYRHVDDWYTRYSITHGSNQGKTKRYPILVQTNTDVRGCANLRFSHAFFPYLANHLTARVLYKIN